MNTKYGIWVGFPLHKMPHNASLILFDVVKTIRKNAHSMTRLQWWQRVYWAEIGYRTKKSYCIKGEPAIEKCLKNSF